MGSKAIVLLGLFLATVLLISSKVAARELAETSNDVDTFKETNGAADDGVNLDDHGGYEGGHGGVQGGGRGGYEGGHGGGHGGYGGGHGGYGGGHGGGSKGGGYCRHGCCGSYKGGCRCCTYAGEKADAEP